MDATKGWIPLYDGAVTHETVQTYSAHYLVVGGGGAGGGTGHGMEGLDVVDVVTNCCFNATSA